MILSSFGLIEVYKEFLTGWMYTPNKLMNIIVWSDFMWFVHSQWVFIPRPSEKKTHLGTRSNSPSANAACPAHSAPRSARGKSSRCGCRWCGKRSWSKLPRWSTQRVVYVVCFFLLKALIFWNKEEDRGGKGKAKENSYGRSWEIRRIFTVL